MIGFRPCAISSTNRVMRRAWTAIRLTGSLPVPDGDKLVLLGCGRKPRPCHDNKERLFLVGPAMRHESSSCYVSTVVSHEMRNLRRNENDLTCVEGPRSLPFDLRGETSLEYEEEFLSARMHVPGGCTARCHFQHIDDRLLDFMLLALEISFRVLVKF